MKRCHDTQHNDTRHDGIQDTDTQHNYTEDENKTNGILVITTLNISVIMLSATFYCYAECHFAECHYNECC
jgi:hypothetical protein